MSGVIHVDPKNANAFARSLIGTDRFTAAVELCKQIVANEPDNHDAAQLL
ncbi:MAG: hypothetical protein HQL40_05300, partial [Alphaproteobacteria bacterium]|nr:hypothetical protein [Alphaproteobacteria bacterium]